MLPSSEYETLFNLIGTTYGGDGQSTFALPDLRGRLPVHQGNGYTLAQTGGTEEVTLTTSQIPSHAHPLLGSSLNAASPNPAGNVPAQTATQDVYSTDSPGVDMATAAIGNIGGSQPHSNFMPYLCVDFIISLYGIFPSPT